MTSDSARFDDKLGFLWIQYYLDLRKRDLTPHQSSFFDLHTIKRALRKKTPPLRG